MKTKVIETLYLEIDWLQNVINQVIKSYLLQDGHEKNWQDIPLPDLKDKEDCYATTIKEWNLNIYQRLALVLAMTPHLKPEVLDVFFGKNQMYDRKFTEFGGVIDKNHTGFLPTGETALFLVSATNPELRYKVMDLFNSDSILMHEQVITLGETENYIPKYNGILALNTSWLDYFLTGEKHEIKQSSVFPAKKISTELGWDDLVLDDNVRNQIIEIISWLKHSTTIMKDWKLDRLLKPGYRTLFYGPPGTGKTLTATLLGKATNRDVYRIDLSMIVSKYIGETEKNLAKVFDVAEHENWILFFDEADALFGKRTSTNNANDRFANQEVSYLLQRIEDFSGVVILVSNLKGNIDEAFVRRFQSMIHFNMPTAEERYRIWKNAFSGKCTVSPDINLRKIAENCELSGGAIINVLRYCALSCIQRNDSVVTQKELQQGIRREFKKENKTISLRN